VEGWTKIYSSDKPWQIEAAKALLHENNIEAVDLSKKDSVYIFGEIELYVRAAEEILARVILSQHNL
jgi:hypothetical protein